MANRRVTVSFKPTLPRSPLAWLLGCTVPPAFEIHNYRSVEFVHGFVSVTDCYGNVNTFPADIVARVQQI